MFRIGTEKSKGQCRNVDFLLPFTQLTYQEGREAEARRASSQRLLHGFKDAKKTAALHDHEPSWMGHCPFGFVRVIECAFLFELKCHFLYYAPRQSPSTSCVCF